MVPIRGEYEDDGIPSNIRALTMAAGVALGRGPTVRNAMTMEQTPTAPFGGTMPPLRVGAGSQIELDAVLAVVKKEID
ncbi:hypothetical protein [Croceicoccus hydrothermalis]|uniref:hypothetical protein n=1 Tax=Croceicoccus hydrothermalis TaxID=2867964 RepID=UPI001EFC1380|nr:hypothetical protein [Croceicoccus hydrothermalis]